MASIISNFICWCGGANLSILNQCPEERTKFESIGAGVLITAMMAGVSMSFAMFSLFPEVLNPEKLNPADTAPPPVKIWEVAALVSFILFWMVVIFSIDWSLVKTMHKKDNPTRWNRLTFGLGVIFRIFVATAIAFTVSKPMEVYLFKNRLEPEVLKNRDKIFEPEMNVLKQEEIRDSIILEGGKQNVKNIQNILNAGCQEPAYLQLKNEITGLERDRNITEAKISQLKQSNNSLKNRKDCYVYDENGVKQRMADNCWIKYRKDSLQIKNLQVELAGIETDIDNKTKDKDDIEKRWKENLEAKKGTAEADLDTLKIRVATDEKKRRITQEEIDKALQYYKPNLITYIEAIHTLEKKQGGEYVFWVRWLVFFVILLIDTAPIIIKLLMKRGGYEAILERIEYERNMQQQQLRFVAQQERESNERLVDDIAVLQRELIREAMLRYHEEEKRNMLRNYTNYFRNNQQRND